MFQMATNRTCVTTPSGSAAHLHRVISCGGDAQCVSGLPYHHKLSSQCTTTTPHFSGLGKHLCRALAPRSGTLDFALALNKFSIGNIRHSDAGAIPVVDVSGAQV